MRKTANKEAGDSINVTTQRRVATASYNYVPTGIKAVASKPTVITREELNAVTRNGKDVFYTAAAEVALRRGIWILKEA